MLCDKFKGLGLLTDPKPVLGKPPGALAASCVSILPQFPIISEGHSQPLRRVGGSAHSPGSMGTSGPSTCESELPHTNANHGCRDRSSVSQSIDSFAVSPGCGQGGVLRT